MLSNVAKNLFQKVIALSESNFNSGNVPIAAIVYDYINKEIVAEAVNSDSPIGHAELLVIQKALEIKKAKRLNDCDIYITIEPCLMCATAISKCHFRRVYFGAEDLKGGAVLNGPRVFDNNNLKKVEVISHIEEELTSKLLKKFFQSKRN
tara:strand:- start:12 stop:461 length:450 start_codon:yes stop_codon:yes gene_type:complete